VKCGDLIQCQETQRLAIAVTEPDNFGWFRVHWIDEGITVLAQNIAWENITKAGQKMSSTNKLG
jgi:hypothetical protein